MLFALNIHQMHDSTGFVFDRRQKAVQDLTGIALESAGNSRKVLSGIGDLERALARLHTSTLGGSSSGRDADHVILYEDSAKRKVGTIRCHSCGFFCLASHYMGCHVLENKIGICQSVALMHLRSFM